MRRTTRAFVVTFTLAGTAGAFVVSASCLSPTEVVVEVIASPGLCDLPGAKQTGIFASGPLAADSTTTAPPQTAFGGCSPKNAQGSLGTITVQPTDKSKSVEVQIAMNVGGGSAEQCMTPGGAKTCIIARRIFGFVEHQPLSLKIPLDPKCLGTTCDPASTCYDGNCVSANVTCASGSCELADASAPDAARATRSPATRPPT